MGLVESSVFPETVECHTLQYATLGVDRKRDVPMEGFLEIPLAQ